MGIRQLVVTKQGKWVSIFVSIVVVISLMVWWLFRGDTGLHGINPFIEANLVVEEGEIAILGFHIENRGNQPVEILEGISQSIPEVVYQGIWVGEIAGSMSGSFEDVVRQWYAGHTGPPPPIAGEGYTIRPGEYVAVTFVYQVNDVGIHHIRAPIGIMIKHRGLVTRRWLIEGFEAFNLRVRALTDADVSCPQGMEDTTQGGMS